MYNKSDCGGDGVGAGVGVDRLALVADLGHEPRQGVRRVGGGLDPAVRQGDHEGSLHVAL